MTWNLHSDVTLNAVFICKHWIIRRLKPLAQRQPPVCILAYLNGWTAKYLPHVASPNEVPGSLSAYRTQQF
eukprot:scaffold196186_cov17-Tisochrysis_lutea.AAC.1